MAYTLKPRFIKPADALPGWMEVSGRDVDGRKSGANRLPVNQVPVVRTQEPTMQDAARAQLQETAPLFRELPLFDGATDKLPVLADQQPNIGLIANLKNSRFKRCSDFHDDIVCEKSTENQDMTTKPGRPAKTPKEIKPADMFVWNQIEDELNRRRLPISWLYRKLGESRQTISGWKNGERTGRSVPVRQQEKVAELFGWSLERLTTGKDSEPVAVAASAPAPERPSAPPVSQQHGQSAHYSPMALDLAGMFDAIGDDQQKRRVYALIIQMLVVSSPPSPGASAPGAQQTPALQQHR
jgi:hypothetical protein